MNKKEKQFYDKIEELELELRKQQAFCNAHKFHIEAMSISENLNSIHNLKIQYSLFFDGTFTVDQIDLTK